MYENICEAFNKGAGGKEEIGGSNPEVPSIYVGKPHVQSRKGRWNIGLLLKGAGNQEKGAI